MIAVACALFALFALVTAIGVCTVRSLEALAEVLERIAVALEDEEGEVEELIREDLADLPTVDVPFPTWPTP